MMLSTHLDGGPSEAAQLFDVLPFLSNDGSHCLCWDVYVDSLLFWSLNTHRAKMSLYTRNTYHGTNTNTLVLVHSFDTKKNHFS